MSERTRAPATEVARWPWRDIIAAHAALDAVEAIDEIMRERAKTKGA